MSGFRRKAKVVQTLVPRAGHEGYFRAEVPQAVADSIAVLEHTIQLTRATNEALKLEADQITQAAQAMREAHHRQIEGLNSLVHGLQAALAVERKARGKAQAEVLRLDAELVKTGFDLGRERDEHRALRQRWARHLNSCAVAEAIDGEDTAKAASNR